MPRSARAANLHGRHRKEAHDVHTALSTYDDPLLFWLRLDAVFSGTAGLLLTFASPWLDGRIGASPAFPRPARALFLLAYAGGLAVLVDSARRRAALVVVTGNAAWVLLSLVAVAADWLTLTTLGAAFGLAQAPVVGLLAVMQLLGVRDRP